MSELIIEPFPGPWIGNDYGGETKKNLNRNTGKLEPQPYVSMVKVSMSGRMLAVVFTTHMNLNFDGGPTAYGPPDWQRKGLKSEPLDVLGAAGKGEGYYGVVAVDPKTRMTKYLQVLPPEFDFDAAQADVKGRCPVIQKDGDTKGFYVSGSAKVTGLGKFCEQKQYVNSHAVPFHALSYRLGTEARVQDKDFGFAIRHDSHKTADFWIMGGEGHGKGSGAHEWAVGECSYKVFLDIGGKPKPRGSYADNGFTTSFVIFPGSKISALPVISTASNSLDFAVLMALFGEADAAVKGSSPIAAYRNYVSGGRAAAPRRTMQVIRALSRSGYTLPPAMALMGQLAKLLE